MAEDSIPGILAEQRLGHEVPGMRGLYAHASDRMRNELKAALQARWEDALRTRAAPCPHSPVPLLDTLLAPLRGAASQSADPEAPTATVHNLPTLAGREKMISQILPRNAERSHPRSGVRPVQGAPELA
jgi:hypothetical protein